MDNKDLAKRLALQRATMKALTALGGPIMMTIDWHLKRNGIFLESQDIDIHKIAKVIEEIIGDGVDSILDLVYMALVAEVGENKNLQFQPDNNVTQSSQMLPLDRIDQF
jgi:hypothetical protein